MIKLTMNYYNFVLLAFCQKEIIDISEGWNYHRVRSTKGSICPAGIPEVLFFVPELYDGHDYESAVDDDLINFTDNTLGASLRKYGCTDEFAELCLERTGIFRKVLMMLWIFIATCF